MNKKGFLLGEFTLKIVIAVFCILLLVLLVMNIYGSFSKKDKIRYAGSNLDQVIKEIDAAVILLNGGESEKEFKILPQPKKWVLVSYIAGGPKVCGNEKCLCVCENKGWFTNQLEKCNSTGVCKITKQSIRVIKDKDAEGIALDQIVDVGIKKEADGYLIYRK